MLNQPLVVFLKLKSSYSCWNIGFGYLRIRLPHFGWVVFKRTQSGSQVFASSTHDMSVTRSSDRWNFILLVNSFSQFKICDRRCDAFLLAIIIISHCSIRFLKHRFEKRVLLITLGNFRADVLLSKGGRILTFIGSIFVLVNSLDHLQLLG